MSFACRHQDLSLYAYGFLEPAETAVIESHLQSCAECREALADLRDESILVAFELSLEPGEATATPSDRRRDPGRILAVAAAVAAMLLVIAVLHSVFPGRDAVPGPARPETPVAVGPGMMDPPDRMVRTTELEKTELLRRIAALEEEVRRLSVAGQS